MDRENINNSVKKSLKDEFCVWSEAGNTYTEKEISEEYILPDYMPDVRKILLVRVNQSMGETYKDEGKADIFGRIGFNVIYLSDSGEIKCIAQDYDFELTANSEAIYEESYLDVRTGIKNKSARAVSSRKLLLKAKIFSNVKVYNKLCVYPRVIGTTGIEDEFTLERNTGNTECVNYIKFSENDIRGSEDIVLQGGKTIKELVCSDIVFVGGECEYSDGKANIKGIAKLWALLDVSGEGESSEYEEIERNVQFNHIAEITLPSGEWKTCVKLERIAFECGVANDSYGEPKVIEADFSVKADVLAMTNESSVFTDDVYSTEYTYSNKYKNVETQKVVKVCNVNFSSYGAANLNLSEGERLDGIAFSYAEVDMSGFEQRDGKAVFTGECNVKTTLKTTDGGYKTEESSFPIRYEMALNGAGDVTCMNNCYMIGHRAELDGNRINFNAEIGMNVALLENVNEKTVESVTIDKSSPFEKSAEKVMILYYPENSETLWSIAKKYVIPREEITKLNRIENTNQLPRVMLIPTNIQ